MQRKNVIGSAKRNVARLCRDEIIEFVGADVYLILEVEYFFGDWVWLYCYEIIVMVLNIADPLSTNLHDLKIPIVHSENENENGEKWKGRDPKI